MSNCNINKIISDKLSVSKLTKTQEIDITIPSSTPYQPSVQSLLPSNYPISSFPYIQSIHCYDNSLLCATTTGMFYLFTITAYIGILFTTLFLIYRRINSYNQTTSYSI